MLATKEDLKHATELNRAEIIRALSNSGYGSEDIIDVTYKGFNGRQFVYEITYPSPEDDCQATGQVFISLKRLAFSTKFDFYGEY